MASWGKDGTTSFKPNLCESRQLKLCRTIFFLPKLVPDGRNKNILTIRSLKKLKVKIIRKETLFPLEVSGLPICRFKSPYQPSHKTKKQRGDARLLPLFTCSVVDLYLVLVGPFDCKNWGKIGSTLTWTFY
jgi:hypothetical protein